MSLPLARRHSLSAALVTCLGLTLAAPLPAQQQPATQPPATQPTTAPAPTEVQYQPPRTPDEIASRINRVESRLAELDAQTLPTTAPGDEIANRRFAALQGLRADWQTYRDRLQEILNLHRELETLTSEDQLNRIAELVRQLQQEAQAITHTQPPLEVTEPELATAQSVLSELDARIKQLEEEQARRAAQLSERLAQRRTELETALGRLRETRTTLQQQLDAGVTTAPAERATLEAEYQRLEPQIALLELNLDSLSLLRRKLELTARQDDQLLAALRSKRAAQQQYVNRLSAARSRTRVDILELRRQAATQPTEIARIDLQLFVERALIAYFARLQQDPATPRLVVSRLAERLEERIRTSKTFWNGVLDSLEYRSGDEAQSLHTQIRREIATFTRRLDRLGRDYADRLEDLRALQTARERILQRFNELADAATQAVGLDPARQTRLDSHITELRAQLTEDTQTAIAHLETRTAKFEEVLQSGREHTQFLRNTKRRVHWRRMRTADAGILGADWRAARRESKLLFGAPPISTQAAPPIDQLDQLLAGTPDDAGVALRTRWREASEAFHRVSRTTWLVSAAGVVAALILGILLTRIARRKGKPLAAEIERQATQPAEEDENAVTGISARIDLLAWNMVGDLAILVLISTVLAGFLQWSLEEQRVRLTLLAPLGMVVLTMVLLRLEHHLFEADSPPHRVLPCSDAVAKHYRWWLTTGLLVSLVLLIAPLTLYIADIAPALQAVTIEVYKTIILVLLILFLLPKQLVLDLMASVPSPLWIALAGLVVYPLIFLLALGMLILQVVGYGALVTFVGGGSLLTAAVLIVAAAASEYLVDLMHRYHRHGAMLPEAAAEHGADGHSDPGRARYVLLLLAGIVRLLAVVAVLFSIVQIWNIPLGDEWIDWRLIGFGLLVFVIAFVLDRVIFAGLLALQHGGRLPESMVNLIRRWVRIALTALVVLSIVALAGWKIDSLWTFLTTLLAMIAIGFVAVWSILSNILATLVILIWRPFNVGEHIEVQPEGTAGQVIDISFMYTILKTESGGRISIPNNLFAQRFIKRTPMRGVVTRTLAEQLEAEKPLAE